MHNLQVSPSGEVSATLTVPVPESKQTATIKLSGISGKRLRALASQQRLRARYDAAQTTDDNRRHWCNADNLSANAANSPQVRHILRNRSRYELANNSYGHGIKLTLANHTIGSGPRVQITGPNKVDNRIVQALFMDWAAEVGAANTLRVGRMDKFQSGEAFLGLVRKRRLECPVQLGLVGFEADRISDPTYVRVNDPKNIDGILLDDDGDPMEYRVLRYHPGDMFANPLEPPDVFPAKSMCHWFLQDRSGQHRGIPEATAALPLFADLRRFTLAVIAAAETAADAAGVIYSDAPASDQAEVDPLDTIDLEKRMFMTLPAGWKMGQIEAQQPVTTYADFKREILKEIGRCLNMPYNIVAGDSSDYNFASGRLDHQVYVTSIWVDRSECERVVLRKIFRAWFREAQAVTRAGTPYLPDSFSRMATIPPFGWFWDELDLGDPVKNANAQEIRLRNHTTTLAYEYAKDGVDWEEALQQRSDEIKRMEQLGIPLERPETITPENDPNNPANNPANNPRKQGKK